MKLSEFGSELRKLSTIINEYEEKFGYDCDEVDYDSGDKEDSFQFLEMRYQFQKMKDAADEVAYLSKPVNNKGRLSKNKGGRYQFPDGKELTSGTVVEILVESPHDGTYWELTRIEHNGEDYYAYALGRTSKLDGIMARTRR